MSVALNCWERPAETERFAGLTTIESSDEVATLAVVLPLTLPYAAVMTVVPGLSACTTPVELTEAVAGTDEDHVAN